MKMPICIKNIYFIYQENEKVNVIKLNVKYINISWLLNWINKMI